MNVAPPKGLFSSNKVDVEIAKSVVKKDTTLLKNNVSKIWLTCYLGDIGSRLRSAGWKEDEVSDMINPPASYVQLFKGSERKIFIESLAYHVNLLFVSLKKAGWRTFLNRLNFIQSSGSYCLIWLPKLAKLPRHESILEHLAEIRTDSFPLSLVPEPNFKAFCRDVNRFKAFAQYINRFFSPKS